MPVAIPLPQPAPFLTVREHRLDTSPTLCGLCAGYELSAWRLNQLVDHIVEWLPEFALAPAEWSAMQHANAIHFIRRAAHVVYQSKKFTKRGEFGELFLHAAIRQVHNSLPAISKIYYKTAPNDTVKGFDAVHVVGPADDLELWLGEAKFYGDIGSAIREVVDELKTHLGTDYLRTEFLLLTGKIDDAIPHAEPLKRLLSPNTSLDDVFKRACIPVLLTYNSKCLANHSECNSAYASAFTAEVTQHYQAFVDSLQGITVPTELRIHLFLLPLHTKEQLVAALDGKLKAWQQV